MLKKTKYNFVLAIIILTQVAISQNIKVEFQSNKSEYINGEPALLRTTILNFSEKDFKGKLDGYGWHRDVGFTMYVANDGNDFENILDIKTKLRLEISTPPRQYELFQDRHFLPGNLSSGEKAERFDMLIIPKPGDYRLKAVLREPDGRTYMSEPIRLKILTIKEKNDSIWKLGRQDFIINLGSSIYYAHYVEKLWGGYPPGESLRPEKFEELAPVIREQYKDSVFREYVMYADVMTHYNPRKSTHELIEGRKELAEQFLKEYPNSWLLPEVYRKLFWTYIAEKDRKKAEQVRNKAIEIAPNATVLKEVREFGPVVLKELQQAESEPVQNKTQP